MADSSDSSLAFFTKATSDQWSYVLKLYGEVLRLKATATRDGKKGGPEELIKLDTWFQEKLPKIIHSRKDPHLVHEELVQVTKWKLMRGKFRPRLLDLVRINTEQAVKLTTRKAFRKLSSGNNLSQAITALTTLKGIGPATASAVLVAAYPEYAPFMADESMLATPGVEATDYTLAEYMNYSEQIKSRTEKLKAADPEGKWTPHKVEMALWTHYLARELKPSLLDNMPKPNGDKNLPSSTTTTSIPSINIVKSDDNDESNGDNKITSTTTSAATNGKQQTDQHQHSQHQSQQQEEDSSFSTLSEEKSNDSNSLMYPNRNGTELDDNSISKDFVSESSDSISNIRSNIIDNESLSCDGHVVDNGSNDNAVDGVEEPAFKRQRLEIISSMGDHDHVAFDVEHQIQDKQNNNNNNNETNNNNNNNNINSNSEEQLNDQPTLAQL